MKRSIFIIAALVLIIGLCAPVYAEDIRKAAIIAEQKKNQLLEQSRLEKARAEEEARIQLERITDDKIALFRAIDNLEVENKSLGKEISDLRNEKESLSEQRALLNAQIETAQANLKELQGFVSVSARDLDALLQESPQNVHRTEDLTFLEALGKEGSFPSLDEISAMMSLYLDEITRSGEVSVHNGIYVDRAGREQQGKMLLLGNFTAAYQSGEETGFLVYSSASNRFFALSRLPGPFYEKAINDYMAGQSAAAPVDISRGAALRQFAQEPGILAKIPQGGPLVWPIAALAIAALIIVLERLFFLLRVRTNADKLMKNVAALAREKEWDQCLALCKKQESRPVPTVLTAALILKDEPREDMENALHEAILRQVPRLERFLSTLAVLAAIAPLLGLLGTVTGMINTFSVMTVHGAGDPRMMSGGISEALITTMLGLSVAIPIMLSHALLSRTVENIIAQMEEKSVALVNVICAGRKKP